MQFETRSQYVARKAAEEQAVVDTDVIELLDLARDMRETMQANAQQAATIAAALDRLDINTTPTVVPASTRATWAEPK